MYLDPVPAGVVENGLCAPLGLGRLLFEYDAEAFQPLVKAAIGSFTDTLVNAIFITPPELVIESLSQ